MQDSAKIEVLTFGGLRVKRVDGAPLSYRTRKTASLFAYLASKLGKPQGREDLCGIFWPDAEESFARNSLSVALTSLRKQLEEGSSNEVIVSDHRTVTLSYEPVSCDLVEFERLIKKARLLEDEQGKLNALFDALDVYEGPFLLADDEDWARLERYRLEKLFHQVLCRVLDWAKTEEERHRALNLATRALGWDPKQPDVLRRVNSLRSRLGMDEETAYRRSKAASSGYLPEPAALLSEVQKILDDPLSEVPSWAGENSGGAVPIHSKHYVRREADGLFADCLSRQDSIVLIKGPRQIGKSSLLARGAAQARAAGSSVLLTDFQSMDSGCLQSTKTLYLWLTSMFLDQLGSSERAESMWEENLTPALNLERFLKNKVLGSGKTVFWGLDEVDRVFQSSFRSDFFGLLRSWHNRRAMEPDGPWQRLTLAITYATEAHFFITDLNQSPFNVGTSLELEDFDIRQVAELNKLYGSPLRNMADLQELQMLVGGHPYLVRTALNKLTSDASLGRLKEHALSEDSPFSDHLRRLSVLLQSSSEMVHELGLLLRKKPLTSRDNFYRLKSAGLIRGKAQASAEIRCDLYRLFLRERLKT